MTTAPQQWSWKLIAAFISAGAVLAGGISAAVILPGHGTSALTKVLGIHETKPTDPTNGDSADAANNGSGNSTTNRGANGNGGNPGHPISVTWSVDQLLKPGVPATLNAIITNTNARDILVTRVHAAVTGADRNGCNPSWVDVTDYAAAPGTTILSNSAGTIKLPVVLKDLAKTNQDACKSATFNFTVTADARQA